MKKILAILTACMLAAGMTATAFAADAPSASDFPDDKVIVDTIFDSDIAGTEVEYTDGMTLNDVLAYAPKCEVTAILANGETKTLESTWFVDDFDREEFESDPYSVDDIPLYMNTPDGYVLQDEEHAYLYFPQSSIHLIHNDRLITEIVAYNGDKEFNVTYTNGMTLDDIINQIPCFIDVKTADGKTSTVKSTWHIDADSGDDIAFSKDPSSVKDLHLVMSIPSGYNFSDFDLNDELPQVVVHLTRTPVENTGTGSGNAKQDTTGAVSNTSAAASSTAADQAEKVTSPKTGDALTPVFTALAGVFTLSAAAFLLFGRRKLHD